MDPETCSGFFPPPWWLINRVGEVGGFSSIWIVFLDPLWFIWTHQADTFSSNDKNLQLRPLGGRSWPLGNLRVGHKSMVAMDRCVSQPASSGPQGGEALPLAGRQGATEAVKPIASYSYKWIEMVSAYYGEEHSRTDLSGLYIYPFRVNHEKMKPVDGNRAGHRLLHTPRCREIWDIIQTYMGLSKNGYPEIEWAMKLTLLGSNPCFDKLILCRKSANPCISSNSLGKMSVFWAVWNPHWKRTAHSAK